MRGMSETIRDYVSVLSCLRFAALLALFTTTAVAAGDGFDFKGMKLPPGFTATTTNEQISFNINVKKLMRGLFTGAGITEGNMDFNTLQGRMVGFGTKLQKDDPSRLEVSYFFTPKV